MKTVLDRMLAFRQSLSKEPVRLHIYNDHTWVEPIAPAQAPSSGWSQFARNVLMFVGAVCVAYGAYDYASMRQAIDEGQLVELPAQDPEAQEEELSPREKAMLEVRHKLNFVETKYRGRKVMVLDMPSRILLAQTAAQDADLQEAGLNWKDLYGIIHAETEWVPRDGMGKNKVVSQGLAQMEPTTARNLGIKDPNDEVDAVFGAALLLKEAGQWSHSKVARLKVPPKVKAQKLREGVSIYYNLSTALKKTWNGTNTHQMPDETNYHIRNSREGAAWAGHMELKMNKARLLESVRQNSVENAPPEPERIDRRRYERNS